MSENANVDNGVFSGSGLPDMLDSARLAIKTKMQKSEPILDENPVQAPASQLVSKKLQLEHHHCVRLLKAVYDWLNAARKLYHRVATDLRKRRDEKSSHATLPVDFLRRKWCHSGPVFGLSPRKRPKREQSRSKDSLDRQLTTCRK